MVKRRKRRAGVGRAAGRDAGEARGSVRQECMLKGKLAAAHLLLAELFLHVPLEHLV